MLILAGVLGAIAAGAAVGAMSDDDDEAATAETPEKSPEGEGRRLETFSIWCFVAMESCLAERATTT